MRLEKMRCLRLYLLLLLLTTGFGANALLCEEPAEPIGGLPNSVCFQIELSPSLPQPELPGVWGNESDPVELEQEEREAEPLSPEITSLHCCLTIDLFSWSLLPPDIIDEPGDGPPFEKPSANRSKGWQEILRGLIESGFRVRSTFFNEGGVCLDLREYLYETELQRWMKRMLRYDPLGADEISYRVSEFGIFGGPGFYCPDGFLYLPDRPLLSLGFGVLRFPSYDDPDAPFNGEVGIQCSIGGTF
ncbi:MAG: hypothetical protein KDD64_11300 [Bdellovibrionales bacterium]|nr:hypothetical protein [Bdellovibrionales bacterium]